MKNKYLAFVLDEESRSKLIRLFKPSYSQVLCDHVTIEFNLDRYGIPSQLTLLDSKPSTVKAIGIARGDGVECIAISIDNNTVRADGSFYHVTLSVEPPHKPFESNTLKDQVSKVRGIIYITGHYALLNK